jgi:hypothetical protein
MLFLRTGHPPRLLKRMLTSAEACELRMFYARYPFDDESNHWLPNAMLMADIHARFSGAAAEKKAPIDFMPFAKNRDEEPEPVAETRPYSRKQLKRIQKYKGW